MPPRDRERTIQNVTMAFEDGRQIKLPEASLFIEKLNAVWTAMDDDFELADEEEYVATSPISFDELMGGNFCDNRPNYFRYP